MLIGKPLLEQTCTVQEYESDTILLPEQDKYMHIENYKTPWTIAPSSILAIFFLPGCTQDNISLTLSDSSVLTDTIPSHDTSRLKEQLRTITIEKDKNTPIDSQLHLPFGYSIAHSLTNSDRINHWVVMHIGERETKKMDSQEKIEEPVNMTDGCSNIEGKEVERPFTRLTEEGLFHPPRVKKILDLVQYGPLPDDKLQCLKDKVIEFADTFTLSVQEVKPVDFIKFKLDIPEGTVFPLVFKGPVLGLTKDWDWTETGPKKTKAQSFSVSVSVLVPWQCCLD